MKKGSETLMFSIATIGLVLVLFFAWFVFSGLRDDGKSKQEIIVERELNNNFILLNFLRTPFEFNGNNGTIADLIVDSYYRDKYGEFEEISKTILNPLYDNNKCYEWNLELKLMPDEEKLKSIINLKRIGASPITDSNILIPLLDDSNKNINVRLYEEC